jgi:hypothetical protein
MNRLIKTRKCDLLAELTVSLWRTNVPGNRVVLETGIVLERSRNATQKL